MDNPKPPRRRDLTSGPIPSTLLIFALPVLGSNILQSLNGSINSVFVGRFLGETALAATSNANLVLFLVLGTMFGIGMAAMILVAQAVGARDVAEARRIVGTSALLDALPRWRGEALALARQRIAKHPAPGTGGRSP